MLRMLGKMDVGEDGCWRRWMLEKIDVEKIDVGEDRCWGR
jgi:hypothetical protein